MIERDLTPEGIDYILAHGPLDDLRRLPIALSMDPPEGIDVERICHDLTSHHDAWVRGNAALAFGHLARVMRELGREDEVKRVLQSLLHDEEPIVRGHAADAISDIRMFLGWRFDRKKP